MVVFLVKNSNEDQFLFESTTAETNDNLIRKLVHMWNTRLQLNRLVMACRGLMTHGPSKPPKEHGIDSVRLYATSILRLKRHFVGEKAYNSIKK